MADDDDSSNKPKPYRAPQHQQQQQHQQEIFQRAQETPAEHRFPVNPTGIVPLPRGSRGAKSLYLKRYGDSFGFTLRHFIVYPPDSVTDHTVDGDTPQPIETIFVKNVKERGPAKEAGLQCGHRILAVNGVTVLDKTYAQVIDLISNSPNYMHLLVVPKEEDVLQQLYAKTAHNPASNQPPSPESPVDHRSTRQLLVRNINQQPNEFQVDALSWHSLRQPYSYFENHPGSVYERGQRSADNLLQGQSNPNEIYAEIYQRPHEISYRPRCRAQPQVPLYKKMGRRASDGCSLSERAVPYESSDFSSIGSDLSEQQPNNMKTIYKLNYLQEPPQEMPGLNYPNRSGCRRSLDVTRRESSSSLSSSLADGSKDSLNSYDSNSTLTGHETDDSAIMNRLRKNVQRKEEFLRMPMQREFYGQPKKLENPKWPPNEPQRQDSPSRTVKPTHHNFIRVKNDIENERDLQQVQQQQAQQGLSGGLVNVPQQKGVKSPKDNKQIYEAPLGRIYEAATAPEGYDSHPGADDKRMYPLAQQIVYKRAKEFESGRPLHEDDPLCNRSNFSKSELARLSEKRLVPNVTERAHEYETRAVEPRRDNSGTSTNSGGSNLKRIQRDSRSLDSSGSNASSSSVNEVLLLGSKRLSGNVTISSGSKYIHCPPPSADNGKPTDTSVNEAIKGRARSNSAESWVAALRDDHKPDGKKRISRQDVVVIERNKPRGYEAMDTTSQPPYADLPPLIPEPVERIRVTPAVSLTPAPTSKAVRPTQLDLEGPKRPSRHLKPPIATVDTPVGRSTSPTVILEDGKPVVVKRRPKTTNLAEEERAMRRESYLKATEGGRMHIDSDLSDGDISPQVLRSAHRRWRPPMFLGDIQQLRKLFEEGASTLGGSASSSSSASLDREKLTGSPSTIIREGSVHCKILEIDGKRFTDRSWKQTWVVLKGPKLFLHKDRHHQSPVGTSDALDHSLASGVDMRTSVVRVAEDYTKRKNVLRVSAVKPCRSEFLLQADSTEEFADWVKTLQEQVASSTDAELDPINSQQAVPQLVPASTTIQVQGSHLSPQLSKSKATSSRNRSPTGQSPVSKSRKPSQITDNTSPSPKSKTWRGRMAKQFRRIHQGASSPSSPTAPEGSTFGIPLDQCIQSSTNPYVPRFVEVCTDIIDEKGLQTVGIYRVPGNNASITALTEDINRNYEDIPQEDPRWNDLHVVSSLLKSYLRKMPDSLVTVGLYPKFIQADKIECPRYRMAELKRLVKSLPLHNYHTLKHVIEHLNRVVANSEFNRMEAKNLAIVFGPTIVRPEGGNMEDLVNDMMNQCKIVETLLTCADWFFSDAEAPVPLAVPDGNEEFDHNNQMLLLENISKYEALKDPKEKNNGALFSSIISAAQRVKRKAIKPGSSSLPENKSEAISPTIYKGFTSQPYLTTDLRESTTTDSKTSVIPTTVSEMDKRKSTEKGPWFNYSTDKDEFYRRVENFKQETQAMLQRPRKTEITVTGTGNNLSSSASNVNNNRITPRPTDLLTKTHSASNVYTRMSTSPKTIVDTSRNSLNAGKIVGSEQFGGGFRGVSKQFTDSDKNKGSDVVDEVGRRIRRGSSVENIHCSRSDLNANNGNMKKVKYEVESDNQRSGSLDSLNKLSSNSTDDEPDLMTEITTILDQKLKEPNILSGDNLPYADESPEKHPRESVSTSDKENIPRASDLYKNPSLHKNQYPKPYKREPDLKFKEAKDDLKEKDEDTMTSSNVPDNERHMANRTNSKLNLNNPTTSSKLRRSESLNKPERTVSPLNVKLKRSESLNKTAGDRLKRSDSLTKTEKTENNLNKRREITTGRRNNKELTKLKRKNGMPDRSIKRRHTVGGTKDPDKVTWLDNKYQEEFTTTKDDQNKREKNLRTSSPDLSSTRRERLLFEINLVGPDNTVVASLRQHVIAPRPQSFPEAFKVPLESHV